MKVQVLIVFFLFIIISTWILYLNIPNETLSFIYINKKEKDNIYNKTFILKSKKKYIQFRDFNKSNNNKSNNINNINKTTNSTLNRGIIICLYESIVSLGLSLILELRCLGNNDIIYIYYCLSDELSIESRDLLLNQLNVKLIDVCTIYLNNNILSYSIIKQFRSYWIKPLALVHSTLDEVMLMDADDIFLINPSLLWNNLQYKLTGTLFFYDRVVNKNVYFNTNSTSNNTISWLQDYLLNSFNSTHYHEYMNNIKQKDTNNILRFPKINKNILNNQNNNNNNKQNKNKKKKKRNISNLLLHSLVWKRKTCHHQDSSLIVYNKKMKKQSIAMIWYLITYVRLYHYYGHGDKETFWLASELSYENYSFNLYGVAVINGNKDIEKHTNTLCGSIGQYYLNNNDNNQSNHLLYVNGMALLNHYPSMNKNDMENVPPYMLYNEFPSYITKRNNRIEIHEHIDGTNCMTNVPIEKLKPEFFNALIRRRLHLGSIELNITYGLDKC